MAYKFVSNVKDSISGLLSGLNLNNVINVNGALERTAREIVQLIAIPETQGKIAVTLYDGVIDYVAPTDVYGSQFIDFRPQGMTRQITDYAQNKYKADFDRKKGWVSTGTMLAWEYVNGVGRLRVSSNQPVPKIEIDPMTAITGWVNTGSASAFILDETVIWQEPASLRTTLTGASTGIFTKTTPSADFTSYVGVGVGFLAMRTPSIINLTSIELRFGSDASNYYSVSTTTGFLGAWIINDWLITAFDFSGSTTTGTPTVTQMDYTQLRVAHSATITNFYVGGLWVSLPSPHELIYGTDSLFQASGANPSQTITNNGDSVILKDDALVIYEYLTAINIAQQQGGGLSSGTVSELSSKLNGARARNGRVVNVGLLDLYRARNPIQDVPMVTNYYED